MHKQSVDCFGFHLHIEQSTSVLGLDLRGRNICKILEGTIILLLSFYVVDNFFFSQCNESIRKLLRLSSNTLDHETGII